MARISKFLFLFYKLITQNNKQTSLGNKKLFCGLVKILQLRHLRAQSSEKFNKHQELRRSMNDSAGSLKSDLTMETLTDDFLIAVRNYATAALPARLKCFNCLVKFLRRPKKPPTLFFEPYGGTAKKSVKRLKVNAWMNCNL